MTAADRGPIGPGQVTDEQIGAYWDVHQAGWWVGVPAHERANQRARYIREVRADREALRQIAEEIQ